MELIDEIGLEYAHEHGGGLPLSAKEYCNALALWVKKQPGKGGNYYYRHNISFRGTNDEYYFFSYISSNPKSTELPPDSEDYMSINPQAKGSLVTKQVYADGVSDKVDTNFPLGTFYSFGGNQYELMSYGGAFTEIDLFVEVLSGTFRDVVIEL